MSPATPSQSAGRRHLPDWCNPVRVVRRSLPARMALSALTGGIVLIILLVLVVSAMIRDDVYAERRGFLLLDARMRTTSVQTELDLLDGATPEDLTAAAQQIVDRLGQGPGNVRRMGVALVRNRDAAGEASIGGLASDERLLSLISQDLSAELVGAADGAQAWRQVALPDPGGTVPGVVIGSRVTLPQAGAYDLYLFYSLSPEQRLVSLTTRSIVLAATAFLLMLVMAVWVLAWRVLLPIRRTSEAARRLTDGHLDERVKVSGEDEIASLGRAFNEMADSLEHQIDSWERLSAVQRLFVTDVSHELRTPLTSIGLAAEQLEEARDEITSPLARRSLDVLVSETSRLRRLFDDLLTISRVDSGKVQLSAVEQDLGLLVSSVVQDTATHIDRMGAQVRLDRPAQPVIAQMDTVRVERIVRNLLLNALEHAEGTRIDLTVAGDEVAVAVRVRDHGVGMTPEVARKVFDRFYRADTSRKRTLGGSGLGLSIASEDASLHGGSLEAWGWPGEGASFLLTLPRRLGEEGTPGDLQGHRPLPVVPDDVPEVARYVPTSGTLGAPGPAVLPATPVTRRSSELAVEVPAPGRKDAASAAGTSEAAGEAALPPSVRRLHRMRQGARGTGAGSGVTVHGPDEPPSGRTPAEAED
ncbi:MtrAB system histidine kinase MtrB [Actinomyces faecalis]|uniref:MtrAB system histidine kinase MtrB n=1 Tax=Actinomyces faecalis TaxID=2722820 RepID=UPI002E2A3C14|nr:MtrAB system histidine kinase MtrB [Actinomyces faecalis]